MPILPTPNTQETALAIVHESSLDLQLALGVVEIQKLSPGQHNGLLTHLTNLTRVLDRYKALIDAQIPSTPHVE